MWILFAGVLLSGASFTMAVPFLPLFLHELGVGDASINLWAGIVQSSSFLIGAFMAPVWGVLADKYGKKKMVIRAGLSLAVIYSLIAFVQNPYQLVGVRMLHGLVGGFVPASMSIVATVAPEKETGWALGIMQAGTMTGGILGPLFGGLLAEWFGLRASFLAAGVIILLATIAVIVWVHERRPEHAADRAEMRGAAADAAGTGKSAAKIARRSATGPGATGPLSPGRDSGARRKGADNVSGTGAGADSAAGAGAKESGRSMWRDFRIALRSPVLLRLLLLLLVFQLSTNLVQPLLTLHIANLRGSFEGAVLSSGFILALTGIAGILASPFWGRRGEARGFARIMTLCLIVGGAIACTQFFIDNLWLFAAVQFAYGLFVAGVIPSINTLVVHATDDDFRGRSFGLTTSANQTGQMFGPLIGGAIGQLAGIHWVFVLTGSLLVAAGLMVRRVAGKAKAAGNGPSRTG